jgi:beta-ribofuranosylaminobenzene 5'-phosphate synthase
MMSRRLHVRTPSRLHFGLLGWGPEVARQFGGIGLMIDSPGIDLIAEPAAHWIAEGRLAPRVERIITQLRERLAEPGISLTPARLCVRSAPDEHLGLGVGTQLSLAVARAVLKLAGLDDRPPSELARLTGRGSRSGVGLHGFQHGGLIVDGGRNHDSDIRPLVARMRFPEDWSVLIVQPNCEGGLHGIDEQEAFAKLPPISRATGDSLFRSVLLEVVPAVLERDLHAFGAALGELQERVGASFAPAQGGIYATPHAALIVNELKRMGFAGAGQSSWGPTLYAFSELPREEIDRRAEELRTRFELAQSSVFCTSAANEGAVLSCEL